VTEVGIEEIADEVGSFVISETGEGIAYVKEVDSLECGTLYLYDVEKEDSIKIDDDVFTGYLTISPDGGTVAYVQGDGNSNESDSSDKRSTVSSSDKLSIVYSSIKLTSDYYSERWNSYYSVNGKEPKVIEKGKIPIAITNEASLIYYYDGEKISVKKGDDIKVLLSAVNSRNRSLHFNKDYTEVIVEDDGKTYYSVMGKEKEILSNDEVSSFLMPDDCTITMNSNWIRGFTYGVESFRNQFVHIKRSLYFIDDNYELDRIAESYDYACVSKIGFGVVYTYGNTLYKVSNAKRGTDKEKLADGLTISALYASGDLKYIYYINEKNELYCKRGTKKESMLASEVYRENIIMDVSEDQLYFVSDDASLYNVKAGYKTKILEAWTIDFYSYYDVIYTMIYNDAGRSFYVLKDGIEQLIFEILYD